MKNLILICLCFITLSLTSQNKKELKSKIIFIQTLGEVNPHYVIEVKKSLELFYQTRVIIKSNVTLSDDILSPSKTRYDANKILNKFNGNEILLILTEKDITTKKDNNPEWGIFGLGFCPGKTCIISTYRLSKNVSSNKVIERLIKVAIHEIGHNMGLEHCNNHNECLMNDAGGTIKQVDNEKLWFCNKCREKI